MGVTWSQIFPPPPTLTEDNVPSQTGRVFMVTGGASGVGYELCSILYRAGGRVYLAARSEAKAKTAIQKLQVAHPEARGELRSIVFSLDDLSSIKPAVAQFRANEPRLDVLFNNAGVSHPPLHTPSAQGHELTMATNCLGPYLLTQLLCPTLINTAKSVEAGSTRVVWAASIMTEFGALGARGLANPEKLTSDLQTNYTMSKTANWFLADALDKQVRSNGVLSVAANPGNLKTQIIRHLPSWVSTIVSFGLYEARFGSYTYLWAGLTPDLTLNDAVKYVLPWGRLHLAPREDLILAMRSKEDGGTGVAASFIAYCQAKTEDYL